MRRIFRWYIFLLFTILIGCIRSYCSAVKNFKERESYSIVLDKYRISWNHNEAHFEVKDFCGSSFKVNGDSSGLFDYVEVGDSIRKEANSFKATVYRKSDGSVKIFKMNFGCN